MYDGSKPGMTEGVMMLVASAAILMAILGMTGRGPAARHFNSDARYGTAEYVCNDSGWVRKEGSGPNGQPIYEQDCRSWARRR